jgi:hypothetical protein
MSSRFYIYFSMKTPEGWETFARFNVGSYRQKAIELFSQLQGNSRVDEAHPLSIDFVEETHGLPVNLKVCACSLAQLGENSKIITRELFRWKVMETDVL